MMQAAKTANIETRNITTDVGEYARAEFDGTNESGFVALGERVLVLPDQPVQRSQGGVYFTDDSNERKAYGAETGVIVSVGTGAFVWSADRMHKFEGRKPEVGDRIFFERYAGGMMRGSDGKFYRAMDDTCIAALMVDPD